MLEAAVFICGACTMILELVGSRILAPYVGTSIYVWTSLIGVILGCLSLGYWWGGRLSDRNPQRSVFSLIIFFSGIVVAGIAWLGDVVLVAIQQAAADIRLASVLATFILFGAPSVLLGMVTPYSVRLKLTGLGTSGATVGSLYACSTLGSILGTFLAGFFLLAYCSTTATLLVVSILLTAVSILLYSQNKWRLRILFLFALIAAAAESDLFGMTLRGANLIDVNTRYNRVWIYRVSHSEEHLTLLSMLVNDSHHSAMFVENDKLVYEYTKYFRLVKHFNPSFKKALMIGGGAYSFPKHYLKEFPEARIDVAEIDPGITALAKKYFRLKEDPRLRIFHEDARVFLNETVERYDAVFGDAFQSYSIPYQLTTKEAVQRIHDILNDGGIVLVNIISAVEGPRGRFLRAELATYRSVFPQVYLFVVTDPENGRKVQNQILLAIKSSQSPKFYSEDPELDSFLHHIWIRDIPQDIPVLTDRYAPVERYIMAGGMKVGRNAKWNPMRIRMRSILYRVFKKIGPEARTGPDR